jgi:hypothetical protein
VRRPAILLDPMERISEILFAVIMTLTFTSAFSVAAADDIKVRTMLVAALGCNLAWGIIDGGVYLFTRLYEKGRKIENLRAFRESPSSAAARDVIAGALSPLLASTLSDVQLESMQRSLLHEPLLERGPRLTASDARGALHIGLLCFLATLPIALPFVFIDDARTALRVSNAVAGLMLAVCGYAFGLRSGLWPWATALVMVGFGGATVTIAIALGG